jgi:NAD(P)-dependent dehydrogenase (short-subunit alcohol dehydrogenase family)
VVADVSSKRVLLLGAETDLGRAIAAALAQAGARLALVGASNDSETAFAVQRLSRRLGADVSQAIDATNEMAVRVMVRQVSKALGGLDAVVFDANLSESVLGLLRRHSGREFARRGAAGIVLPVNSQTVPDDVLAALAASGE